MRSLISHLESHLGAIEGGWSQTVDGAKMPVTIVRFLDQPVEGAGTYLTLGLSNEVLSLSASKQVRQELLIAVRRRFEENNIPAIVQTVAQQVLASKRALLHGQVLGPAGPLFDGLAPEALYCAMPVYYADSFATYEGSTPPTVFVWLVPVLASEADHIRKHGWTAFEDILEAMDPDLLDLQRRAVV